MPFDVGFTELKTALHLVSNSRRERHGGWALRNFGLDPWLRFRHKNSVSPAGICRELLKPRSGLHRSRQIIEMKPWLEKSVMRVVASLDQPLTQMFPILKLLGE
jgi:hypothetical protein